MKNKRPFGEADTKYQQNPIKTPTDFTTTNVAPNSETNSRPIPSPVPQQYAPVTVPPSQFMCHPAEYGDPANMNISPYVYGYQPESNTVMINCCDDFDSL